MDFPENEEWRTRLLTEAEIAAALQKLSTEDAIELFQQQMFLRSQGLPEPIETPASSQVAEAAPQPEPEPEVPVNPLFQTADLAEVLQQRATAAVPIIEEVVEAEPEPEPVAPAEAWPGKGATGLVDIPQPPVMQPEPVSQEPVSQVPNLENDADFSSELPVVDSSSAAWWKLEEPEHPENVHPIEDQITDVIAAGEIAPETPRYETYSTEEIANAVNTPPLVAPAVHPFVPTPLPEVINDEVETVLDPAAQASDFIQKIATEATAPSASGGKTPEQIAAELNARFGASKVGPDTGFLAAQIDHVAGNTSEVHEPEVAIAPAGEEPLSAQTQEPAAFGYVSQPITPAFIPLVSEPVRPLALLKDLSRHWR